MLFYLQGKHAVYESEKKDEDRKEGKGRRCCLVDGIHSIPCQTKDLAPV